MFPQVLRNENFERDLLTYINDENNIQGAKYINQVTLLIATVRHFFFFFTVYCYVDFTFNQKHIQEKIV